MQRRNGLGGEAKWCRIHEQSRENSCSVWMGTNDWEPVNIYLFIYLFQISQDLDLAIPPKVSGGVLSFFTKLLHSQEMEVLTGHSGLNVTDSKDYSLGYNMESKKGLKKWINLTFKDKMCCPVENHNMPSVSWH